ncbi:GTP-binding protein gtr2 [Entomophthora muscae]|uniref:GTP-binding protein gtr2 n=1 Tax=Entomophthora muscae TaxID=34485 RepID=A0ACC2U3W1_9FUNG|nr:GTP-binding protein gtr2 [Entomophthora muscae]
MSYYYEDEDEDYSTNPDTYGGNMYAGSGDIIEEDEYSPTGGSDSEQLGKRSSNKLTSSGSKPPRLLLMGLRRSGKSSIQRVVFHKMAPNETLFLESTSKVMKDSIASFIDFQVWDFPGQIDFFDTAFDSDSIFGEVGALVYIVDAQDDYTDSLGKLHDTLVRAYSVNPDLFFEVFVHKVDGLSDDYKVDLTRDIQQRVMDELADVGLENLVISFYPTSIYDHSIFEALSKVLQKMIRQLPTLEKSLECSLC